jgi:hypothetical protein
LSFCRYTVESGEPVIIPDTGKDPRFIDNPLVDVSFINFYAGYPLRATDGRVIGSFCLQGSQARKESTVAMDLLRQLAMEAQEVLRGYESHAPVRNFAPPTDNDRYEDAASSASASSTQSHRPEIAASRSSSDG